MDENGLLNVTAWSDSINKDAAELTISQESMQLNSLELEDL